MVEGSTRGRPAVILGHFWGLSNLSGLGRLKGAQGVSLRGVQGSTVSRDTHLKNEEDAGITQHTLIGVVLHVA